MHDICVYLELPNVRRQFLWLPVITQNIILHVIKTIKPRVIPKTPTSIKNWNMLGSSPFARHHSEYSLRRFRD